jgi:hypothetical protein
VAELEGNVETVWMFGTFLTWACQTFREKSQLFITLRHRTCWSELCERETLF